MQTLPLADAVARIPDGASLMIGGFTGVGTPERVVEELMRQGKRDLTVIANDTAMPGVGIGKLVRARLVKKSTVVPVPGRMTASASWHDEGAAALRAGIARAESPRDAIDRPGATKTLCPTDIMFDKHAMRRSP